MTRLDKYFSGQPCLLTSTRIVKDGEQAYAYYALKIIRYNLSYDVRGTYSTGSAYSGSINLSCNVVDNTRSGDLVVDPSELRVSSAIPASEASGFSTTSLALANNNFSSNNKTETLIIRYSYQGGNWTYCGMAAGGAPELLIRDLESLSQNKEFREAVGIKD